MKRYTQSFLGLFEQSYTGEYIKYTDFKKYTQELQEEHNNYVVNSTDKYAEKLFTLNGRIRKLTSKLTYALVCICNLLLINVFTML